MGGWGESGVGCNCMMMMVVVVVVKDGRRAT